MVDLSTFARKRGLIPDWAWYQINGASAQDNWIEQREKRIEQIKADDDIIFTNVEKSA